MKVFVSGATGRVGKELRQLIQGDESMSFVGGFAREEQSENQIVNDYKKAETTADVVVDFSLPESFSKTLDFCRQNKVALVSGTTGLFEDQKSQLTEAGKDIAVMWSANMSIGVHLMKHLLAKLPLLDSFDVQMTEHHHKHKKDAPSGTAVLLQEVLDEKSPDLPRPLSVRGGGIYGNHLVELMSEEEILRIEHQALNRAVFAKGALKAAQWLVNKQPGVYQMEHVLFGEEN